MRLACLANMWTLRQLISRSAQSGELTWIGVRPEPRAAMLAFETGELLEQRGLNGDRSAKRRGRARQVTLLQHEHLEALASMLGQSEVRPEQLRRNLVVSGFNLLSVRRGTFSIGETVLEGTGHCHPCSRLEETLGLGGYNACRGHGGITARVIEGGVIRLGDEVRLLKGAPENGA